MERNVRIVFDATMVKRQQAGIRTYAIGLARALARLPDADVVVLAAHSNDDHWGDAETLRTELTRPDPYSRVAWRQLHVPRLARQLRADAVLVPAPEPVVTRGVRQGIVVHDLGPLLAPAVYGRRRQLHYAATLRSSLARADAVFTPSIATKLDLLRWAGLDQRHPVVAGPELLLTQLTERAERIPSDFVLYVGAMLPHKNVGTVIDSFVTAAPSAGDRPMRLVIVGPDYGGEAQRTMERAGDSDAVEHRGFVSDDELGELYRSARAVIFPSLFEGFGLPLLESLACGAPVVASDIPALREVGGERVTYVRDPTDHQAWRTAIESACRRPGGPPGVISWDSCARVVRDALDPASAGSG